MRIAIIDLGTNSVRFDVHQLGPGQRAMRLHREKLMIRLGQGVFLNGKLDRGASDRALAAFLAFKKEARSLGVKRLVAFATAALRDAEDSERLLKRIREKTGIEIEVISGAEEARLISMGILLNETLPRGTFALVDIGGGSTEISICREDKILDAESFALGGARLQQIFLRQSPPSSRAIDEMRTYIRGALESVQAPRNWPGVERVIGSSGTIRALARILKDGRTGKSFELKELRKLNQRMSTMSLGQLLRIPHMEFKRADFILAGSILLEEIMTALGAKKVTPSEYSLRDGILAQEMVSHRHLAEPDTALHFPNLYLKSSRFGGNEPHQRKLVEVAEQLFLRLRSVHRLGPEWMAYLGAAVVLRDCGEAVSLMDHERHSHYIIRHLDLPSTRQWELELISELCLYHEGGKVDLKALPYRGDLPQKRRFLKLLALLQVVDALDAGPEKRLNLKRIRVESRRILLEISRRSVSDMEMLRLERKKKLFENVFRRALEVKRT